MSSPDDTDDAELIRRVQDGDREAFGMLHDRYDRRLYGLALTLTRHRTDAENLCQEVWLRAYRGLPNYNHDGRFRPWLFLIARNYFLGECRRNRGKKIFVDSELLADVAADVLADRSEETQSLRDCLSRLSSENSRHCDVIQRVLDGQSIAEIAGALQEPAPQISQWKFRAIEWLKVCTQLKEQR